MTTPEERAASEAGPYFLMRGQRDILMDAMENLGELIGNALDTPGFTRDPDTVRVVLKTWRSMIDAALEKGGDGECPNSP